MSKGLKFCRQSGQSLWEVVIALAVVALVTTGLIRVITMAIKGARFSSNQSQATALAQKKIADLIDLKNTNFDLFWEMTSAGVQTDAVNPNFCLLTTISDVTLTALPTQSPNWDSAKMAKTSVTVFWDEKGAGSECDSRNFSHKLYFETYATN